MTHDKNLSPEMRGAYVDGELAGADWAQATEQMRSDEALRADVHALQQVKTLVRHAYAGPPAMRKRPAHGVRGLAVAALCLLSVGAGWIAHSMFPDPSGFTERTLTAGASLRKISGDAIIVHVGSSARETLAVAIEEIEDVLRSAERGGRRIDVELVANSSGLDVLRVDTSAYAARIAALRARYPGFTLVACNQTIGRLHERGVAVRLLPGVEVAPSALEQVVKRLQGGWAYVRA